MPLEQAQAQVGGVTMGTNIPNPIDSASAGVQTGAEWAMRNYQVQTQMQMMQAQAQQMQLENMKTRYAIGTTLYDRMQRIAKLPLGTAKNSEIDLLGEDMSHLGMQLHPSAVALMKDKELSKGLGTVLNSMQSGDPNERVQAISQLPNFLSSDKILDIYQEAVKNSSALYLKQAEMAHGTNLATMKEDREDKRQGVKLDAEKQMFGIKSIGEIRDKVANLSESYLSLYGAKKKLDGFLKSPTGPGDDTIINQFNQLQNNPTLRSYEAQMYTQGAPVIERIRATVNNWVKGTHLSPLQRKQIGQAADYLDQVNTQVIKNQLQPHLYQVQQFGGDPRNVFGNQLLKVLGSPDPGLQKMTDAPDMTRLGGPAGPAQKSGRKSQQGSTVQPSGMTNAAQQAMKQPMLFNANQMKALDGIAAVVKSGQGTAQQAVQWIQQKMGISALTPGMINQLKAKGIDPTQGSAPPAAPQAGGQ